MAKYLEIVYYSCVQKYLKAIWFLAVAISENMLSIPYKFIHWCHGVRWYVSFHRQSDCFFRLTINITKAPHNWLFVRESSSDPHKVSDLEGASVLRACAIKMSSAKSGHVSAGFRVSGVWHDIWKFAPFFHQWSLLLTWITLNSSMDDNHMPSKVWDEITYPFPNFNGCTVELWEWISNFTHTL